MSWNQGYNVDYGYTYGYYREQDPAWLDLSALLRGAQPPSMLHGGTRLRYLELGCGQGVNLCLIAACHPQMEFVGVDFNPQHIAHAQKLARAANLTNVRFIEGDFTQLGANWPESLGHFHYAAAHGILSWIDRPVREGLYQCLDAALEPGGLAYFSYNTLPGWYSTLPVQHLLRMWQVREGLSSHQAIQQGQLRLQGLLEAKTGMTQALPGMRARLEKFNQLDKNYLVQEYLHVVWTCFWFDEVEGELKPHKLNFLGSCTTSDWYLPNMLSTQAKEILAQYSDPTEREVMQDVCINQSFRRDLWVKGSAPLWPQEQMQALHGLRFALLRTPTAATEGENPFKFNTSVGEVTGKVEVYRPLYAALQSGAKTVAELMRVPLADVAEDEQSQQKTKGVRSLAEMMQALGLMLHAGHVMPVREVKEARAGKLLNRAMMQAVLAGAPYKFVVAAQVPWVINASDSDLMLCALHLAQPKANASALADVWAGRLVALGRALLKDGQPLATREAMQGHCNELAEAFLSQTLPTWLKLGVV